MLNTAAVHEHHAVGHFQGFFLVMRDKNTGDMQIVVQAAQPAAQLFANFGIKRAKGLIEQQHFRFYCQGTRQCNALTLSTREL